MKILIIASLLLTGIFGGIWSYIAGPKPHNGPVTVVSRQIDKTTGKVIAVRVRLQKADGDFRVVENHLDESGKVTDVHTRMAVRGRGLFLVDDENKSLQLRADRSAAAIPVFDEAAFKRLPDYIGEGEIAGVRVLKVRTGPAEQWVAPDYNGLILRIEDDDMILEATEVRPGLIEPVGDLPDYPIDRRAMDRHEQAQREARQ